MVKSDKCMGVSQLLGSTVHVPGLPPKSTPMVQTHFKKPRFLVAFLNLKT